MPKDASSFELTLNECPEGVTLTQWLCGELRNAILDGRLRPGTRLPSTREFASEYGLSRGTVVTVFDQLQADGYLCGRVGAGTWVNAELPQTGRGRVREPVKNTRFRPEPLRGLLSSACPPRPFRIGEPGPADFPAKVWTRLASRRLRRLPEWLAARDDGRGYGPLREAIADYLNTSRRLRCSADQIAMVSGIQQALDLLARLLLKPGDPVWMEDPGYFGATIAFRNAGAAIVPVPVDESGLCVRTGRRLAPEARCAYLTPAHQFPLGMAMSLERRLEALEWARQSGAFLIEDDYDSEYRFEGRPAPAMQGFDDGSNVIFVGTFNKLLFPSLRLGYVVLPPRLVEPFLVLRYGTDLRFGGIDQAVLCDFIVEGHLGRHIRRMRELYGGRLTALLDSGRQYLKGLMDIATTRTGLYTAGYLCNGMTSRQAEMAAAAHEIETMGLDRFTLRRADPRALLLGFGGFDRASIRQAVARLARALETGPHRARL